MVAQRFCDVVVAVESEQADCGVAKGGHDVRPVAGADLGVVFCVGDVANPVQPVLDRPVAAQPASYLCGGGISDRRGGERVDDLGVLCVGLVVGGGTGQLQYLGRVGEADAAGDFTCFQGPLGGAPVAVLAVVVKDRDLFSKEVL